MFTRATVTQWTEQRETNDSNLCEAGGGAHSQPFSNTLASPPSLLTVCNRRLNQLWCKMVEIIADYSLKYTVNTS